MRAALLLIPFTAILLTACGSDHKTVVVNPPANSAVVVNPDGNTKVVTPAN